MRLPSARTLRALIALKYGISLAYRAQSALWMINGSIPLIMMLIWLELAGGGEIGGYDAKTFAQYFLFMFLTRQMTPIWVIYLFDRGVKQGELSPMLMRPLHPMWDYVTEHWGELFVRLPIVLVILAVGLSLAGAWEWSLLERVPQFLLGLVLAWTINFLLHALAGMLAFWTDNVLGYDTLVYQLYTMLGGIVVPIELFPETAQKILAWTPFPYILDLPVRMMIGRAEGAELWMGYGLQLAWILALWIAVHLTWRAGIKRYSAAGA